MPAECVTVGIFSDTHCGSLTGLTPDEHNWSPGDGDDPGLLKLYKRRDACWRWFIRKLKDVGEIDVALWVGDLIDSGGGCDRSHDGQSLPAQVMQAISVVEAVGARRNYFWHGTPFHVGQDKVSWESLIAGHFGTSAREGSMVDIRGLKIHIQHKMGISSSPVGRFTPLAKTSLMHDLLWVSGFLPDRADLVLRAHTHRCVGIYEASARRSIWSLPGLQAYGGVYPSRQLDGLPVDFGFLILRIVDRERWSIEPHCAPLKIMGSKIEKIDIDADSKGERG